MRKHFKNLGKLTREARIERGYTQGELAAALGGVHSQFVSNWERGLCAPPEHAFKNVVHLLKISRAKLFEAMANDEIESIKKYCDKIYFRKSRLHSSKKEKLQARNSGSPIFF